MTITAMESRIKPEDRAIYEARERALARARAARHTSEPKNDKRDIAIVAKER